MHRPVLALQFERPKYFQTVLFCIPGVLPHIVSPTPYYRRSSAVATDAGKCSSESLPEGPADHHIEGIVATLEKVQRIQNNLLSKK